MRGVDRSNDDLPEEWHLETRRLGRRVLIFGRLESTSTLAASLADDRANDGIVVLADEQTSGRGKQGRGWQCPAGKGVLLSLLVFPSQHLRRPVLLTAWAAVSVCETILKCTGLQAKIKWPNDILIHGHKVAGILIEQGKGTVVGIGLNVNQTEEDFVDLPQAASLAQEAQKELDCRHVARLLIEQLDEEYARLDQGDLNTLEACWKWRLGLLGKSVMVACRNEVHRGRVRDVSWEGLELATQDGGLLRFGPEAIRRLELERQVS